MIYISGGLEMKIAIVCFDNFTDIDVFLPWDLLNRVRLVGGLLIGMYSF